MTLQSPSPADHSVSGHQGRHREPAGLAPAKGRQDHTTSPSAHASFVCRGHSRPSHPAPNVRDDREAPLLWSAGRGELVKMICPTGIAKFFCEGDWTTQITLNRLMKLIFARK